MVSDLCWCWCFGTKKPIEQIVRCRVSRSFGCGSFARKIQRNERTTKFIIIKKEKKHSRWNHTPTPTTPERQTNKQTNKELPQFLTRMLFPQFTSGESRAFQRLISVEIGAVVFFLSLPTRTYYCFLVALPAQFFLAFQRCFALRPYSYVERQKISNNIIPSVYMYVCIYDIVVPTNGMIPARRKRREENNRFPHHQRMLYYYFQFPSRTTR